MSMSLSLVMTMTLISLPPPLCRGRVVSTGYDARQDRTPSDRAIAEIQAAYHALCPTNDCGRGQIFENPTIGNNAATWVFGLNQGKNTRAKIVYSRRFLNALNDSFGPGASFGVLAHEVGHHLTAALSLRKAGESNWNEELRADYMAGCTLGRAGRSPDELENALRALASVATKSHPSFSQRVPMVRRGYQECQGRPLEETRGIFGIGERVKAVKPGRGCWHYAYRLKEEISLVGPVAAPKRRSKGFRSEKKCQKHRKRMTVSRGRVTEACRCQRARDP